MPEEKLRPWEARPVTLDLDSMTWTCNVCGEERPDALVGVAKRQGPIPEALWNIRFCIDRLACTAYAQAPGEWTGPPRWRYNVRVPVRRVDIEDLEAVEEILQRTTCHIMWTSMHGITRAIILIPADDRAAAVAHALAELRRLQLDVDQDHVTLGVER
jgi:hypothetical protein